MQDKPGGLNRRVPDAFLARGGEAGRLIAAYDWSATPLGPIEIWPESLRTSLGIVLLSPVPMVLLWGEDGIMLYNDAYSVFAGARHPQLLGSKVREGWPEVAEFNDNVMRVGLAGGTLAYRDQELTLYRNGSPERVSMNLDYSPVLGESGRPAGVLAVVVETTERRQTERRLAEERERLLRTFEQAPGFTAMLIGPEHRFEFANSGYRKLVGREDIVGRTVAEILPEAVSQGYIELLDRVFRSGEPFRSEGARFVLEPKPGAEGDERFVDFIFQPLADEAGAVTGILVQGYDVTDAHRDAAQRARAESALRETTDVLQRLADSLPVLVSFMDGAPDLRYRFVNRPYEEWFPHKREAIQGQLLREVIGDAAYAAVRPKLERALAGERLTFDQFMPYKDGPPRHVRVQYVPWSVEGRVEGLYALVQDVTDAKQAEAALRQSEAQFRGLAEAIPGFVWTADANGDLDYTSPRWHEYSGLQPTDSHGSGWLDSVHPDDRDLALARWLQAVAARSLYEVEFRLRRADGTYRWWLARALPSQDEITGSLRWMGVCTEIEDIVAARETLARSREELEQLVAQRTAERDKIWQNSNEMMAVFAFDGRRLAINPAWSRILGYGEDELLDKPMHMITHPEDRPRLKAAVDRLIQGQLIDPFEDRLQHANGSYRTISWTGVPGDGVFYAIGRDVTEQRLAEEALRQAQKMEAVGQLTGGIAHDFNNMLTIIRSSTDLLRRPGLPEERRRRYVDAISDTVDRAAKLTGQLLAFARRQALKPEVFDVRNSVRSMTEMLGTVVGSRIQVVCEVPDDGCYVEADASQFETALVNIAVNARDAMNGEGRLSVRVGLSERMPAGQRGSFVTVSLTDTGVGMSAEVKEKIFEPFFTTKEVGKGTGLGLSQVFGFAKQSGGDVEVESTPGQGSTFTLYLPRASAEKASRHGPVAGADQQAVKRGHGHRVLVVEDNREVGAFSTQLLQDLGYETVLARNGREALAILDAGETFDAVFSDVVMPEMSGLELGQEVRRRFPDLSVVLTSGYSDVLAAEGRYGFELLQKPYAAEELSRVLRRTIRRSQINRGN